MMRDKAQVVVLRGYPHRIRDLKTEGLEGECSVPCPQDITNGCFMFYLHLS